MPLLQGRQAIKKRPNTHFWALVISTRKTADIYTDFALLTVEPNLTEELDDTFDFILGRRKKLKLDHLLVARVNMVKQFRSLIDKEIDAAVIICFMSFGAFAQTISDPQGLPPEWSEPYPPFRIVGNLYYVGANDLAAYLSVSEEGNILINSGLAASASIIKNNIEALGFSFADTKILLTTQAHFDHVGALAAIKRQTGASMWADEKDAGVLTDGGYSDYEFGGQGMTYAPIEVDRHMKDGDTILLGTIRVVILHHPGHTKGSSSYLMDITDEQKTYRVLIANMPNIVTSKRFSEIPLYPDIAKDYAYTFEAMNN